MRTDDHHPVTPADLESALAADLTDALADVEHLVDRHVAAMVALGAESQATIASSRSTTMFTTWLKLKAARLGATGIAALATTGGLAHAGELPAPIQDAVSVAAAPAGITVPTAAEVDEAEQADAEAPGGEAGEPTPEAPEGEAPADDGAAEPDLQVPGEAPVPGESETETETETETESGRQHPANHGADVSAVAHEKGDDHGRRVSQVASANGQAHGHGHKDEKAEKSKGPKDGKGPKDDGRKAGGRDATGAPAAEEAGTGRGHGARHDREQDSRAQGRGTGSGKDRPGKGRSGKGE
jgi:hypothetical protein